MSAAATTSPIQLTRNPEGGLMVDLDNMVGNLTQNYLKTEKERLEKERLEKGSASLADQKNVFINMIKALVNFIMNIIRMIAKALGFNQNKNADANGASQLTQDQAMGKEPIPVNFDKKKDMVNSPKKAADFEAKKDGVDPKNALASGNTDEEQFQDTDSKDDAQADNGENQLKMTKAEEESYIKIMQGALNNIVENINKAMATSENPKELLSNLFNNSINEYKNLEVQLKTINDKIDQYSDSLIKVKGKEETIKEAFADRNYGLLRSLCGATIISDIKNMQNRIDEINKLKFDLKIQAASAKEILSEICVVNDTPENIQTLNDAQKVFDGTFGTPKSVVENTTDGNELLDELSEQGENPATIAKGATLRTRGESSGNEDGNYPEASDDVRRNVPRP